MNRDLLLLALSLMTWGVGEGMFYYFQPLYLEQLGADPVKIGGVLGLVGLVMTLAYLPAGYLSDRLGRRPLLIFAWVLGALATVLMALASHFYVFVAGMLLYGLTAFVSVPLNSYTTAARGRWSVGRALTLISASFSVGMIAGPIIGGWIGQEYGLQANFKLAPFLFVISTGLILFIRPQPVEHSAENEAWARLNGLLSGRFTGFLVLVFLLMFGMYLPQPLTQNFLQNVRQVNLMQIGQLISARSLGVVALNLVLGHLNARLGLLLAQGGVALFSLLIWRGSGLPVYMLGYFLLGGYVTARSLVFAQTRALVQARQMGLAYGLVETANSLAIVIGPPIAGYLYKLQPTLIYPGAIVLILVGLAANLWLSPVRIKDLSAFEEKERAEWTPS
ncbi:MAG: MFS transporter [Chloroflexota bacterium]